MLSGKDLMYFFLKIRSESERVNPSRSQYHLIIYSKLYNQIIFTMPAKKMYAKKKRQYRTKRYKANPHMDKSLSLKADYTVDLSNARGNLIANNSLVETKGYLVFTLNDALDKADYIAIFDQYRINYVTVTFNPVMSTVVNRPYDDTSDPLLVNRVPMFITCIDRDTASNPTDYVTVQYKRPCKETKATKIQKWKFKPNRLINIYRAVADAYMIDPSSNWVDCTYPDIPHFGMQFAMQSSSPGNAYVYEILIKYNISWKNRR
uniref:Capsid protein n=1 Tax=Diporeia sp. associated circular virus TaxID=1299317 RepID=M1STN2_9VIRU|nr:capsid protein [Diporeia sp. associated circular virus]